MAQEYTVGGCSVKARRLREGWSQEELAQKLQIRRQAVYDIESGRYLPNTAVALHMARLFDCAVEDLFAVPPPSMRDKGGIQPRGILIAGCDPALQLLGGHLGRIPPLAPVSHRFASSRAALDALGRGKAHAAAIHFHNEGGGEANVTAARAALPGLPCLVLAFSLQEEGLMVGSGNPLGIRSAADLARPGLRLAAREQGAALRTLLDAQLRKAGIAPHTLCGRGAVVRSHREGAHLVATGMADAALGLRVVAESFGLAFIPLALTRCDLVLPLHPEGNPLAAALADTLQSDRLRREIAALPGYEASCTGAEIARLP